MGGWLGNKKGFTMVELIVVIAILALLAIGAVLAFIGIQANARRSIAMREARMLVQALNHYNERSPNARITEENRDSVSAVSAGDNEVRVVLLTDGPIGTIDFGIIFSSQERFDTALSVIHYTGEDNRGIWRLDEEAVQAIR